MAVVTGWGRTRMTWTGWDDSVWEISDPTQKEFVEIVTSYADSKNLLVNPEFSPDGSTVDVRTNGALDPSFANFVPDSVFVRTNLALNPSFESATGTTVARTNLVLNPNSAVDSTGYGFFGGTGGTGTLTRQTGQTGSIWSLNVTTSSRSTWTAASTGGYGGITYGAPLAGIIAGRTYSFYIQGRVNKAINMLLEVEWYDAANALLSSVVSTTRNYSSNSGSYKVSGVIAPANAAKCVLVLRAAQLGANWLINDWVEMTLVHAEETDAVLTTSTTTPFSGVFFGSVAAGTLGPDFTYAWSGVADASTSQQLAPLPTSWLGDACVVSRSTDRSMFGTYSQRVVFNTSTAANAGDRQVVAGLTIGRSYTLSSWVWIPAGGPTVRCVVDNIGNGNNVLVRDQWARTSITFAATATTHTLRTVVNAAATVKGDDICYVDGVMFEEGAQLLPFFSGDTDPNMLRAGYDSNPMSFDVVFPGTAVPTPTTDGWVAIDKVAGGTFLWRGVVDLAYTRPANAERPITVAVDVRNTGTVAASTAIDMSDPAGGATIFTIQPGEQRRISTTSVLPTAGAAWFFDILQGDGSTPWNAGRLEYKNATMVVGEADLGVDFTYSWSGAAQTTTSNQKAAGYNSGNTGSVIGGSPNADMAYYSTRTWSASEERSLALVPKGTGAVDTYVEVLNLTRATTLGYLGKQINISATMFQYGPQVGTGLDGRARTIMIYITAPSVAAGVMQGYTTVVANTAGAKRVTSTVFIPADATYVSVRLYNGSSDKRDVVRWDNLLIEHGDTDQGYFDGTTAPGGDFTYAWSGVPAASTSVQRALAVPGWTSSGGVFHVSTEIAPPTDAPTGTYVARFVLNHGQVAGGPNQNNTKAIPNNATTISSKVYVPSATGTTGNAVVRLAGWSAEPGYTSRQFTLLRDVWEDVYMTWKIPNSVTPVYPAYFPSGAPVGSAREFFVTVAQLEASEDAPGLPTSWVNDSPVRVDTALPGVPIVESGVFLVNQGVRGLSMPPISRFTSTSPGVAGSRYRGNRTEERQVFWPLVIASDESSEMFLKRERAFYKTLNPDKPGTWTVIQPDGSSRSLVCRYVDDSDQTYDRDPAFFGVATYGINLVAEKPYWKGQRIARRWNNVAGTAFFAGPGIINIAPQSSVFTADISNPGDVDASLVWTLHGAFTSATVGIGTDLISIPFALTALKKLVIDTNPDRLTAYEYDESDVNLTGPYVDRTAALGNSVFVPVKADSSAVALNIVLTAAGPEAYVEGYLDPFHYRAW